MSSSAELVFQSRSAALNSEMRTSWHCLSIWHWLISLGWPFHESRHTECHLWNLKDPTRHQRIDVGRNSVHGCTRVSVVINDDDGGAAHLVDLTRSPLTLVREEWVNGNPPSLTYKLLIAEDGSSVRLKKDTFQILDTRSGEVVSTLNVDGSSRRPSFRLLPGGSLVAVRREWWHPGNGHRLVVFETSTGRQRCSVAILPGIHNRVVEHYSPDARTLALSPETFMLDDDTADWYRTLRLYDIPATPVLRRDRVAAWSLAAILMCYGLACCRRDLRWPRRT